jgi:hypothetical protein
MVPKIFNGLCHTPGSRTSDTFFQIFGGMKRRKENSNEWWQFNCYILREPGPLGTKFKTTACVITGCILYMEIQRGKEK